MELGHWVTGSTGSPGRWISGSLGRWVTKCDPVPCLGDDSSRAPAGLESSGLGLSGDVKSPKTRLGSKTEFRSQSSSQS